VYKKRGLYLKVEKQERGNNMKERINNAQESKRGRGEGGIRAGIFRRYFVGKLWRRGGD